MSGNIRPYLEALQAFELDLKFSLLNGRDSVNEIALSRRVIQIMKYELKHPDSVLVYEQIGIDLKTGFDGADRWSYDVLHKAKIDLFPYLASDAANQEFLQKQIEYRDLAYQIIISPDEQYRSVRNKKRGRSYLYRNNPLIPRIMRILGDEFIRWFDQHPLDQDFYRLNARSGFLLFLEERPDMVTLLRISQKLPLDVETQELKIERPILVDVIELIIEFIPIVGSIVAAYEAYSGVDLFGYMLTDLERGILASSVLLPIAGRLYKGGRAIYSQNRLVSLYGRDAKSWSRITNIESRATATGPALRTIEEAEGFIRTQRRLEPLFSEASSDALSNVVRGTTPSSSPIDQTIRELFQRLASQHRTLNSLDEFAISRILDKGPNVDHIKGQLLEKLLESRIIPWLRNRQGSFALGIETAGKQLEFIPGHLIRDVHGRQITDGMLAIRNNGVLEIAAIFEAKAGKNAARELSFSGGGISSLTDSQRAELRAFSRDAFREQRAAAQQAGEPFNKSLSDIENEIAFSETGGQVRRDIERLSENAEIRVGLI